MGPVAERACITAILTRLLGEGIKALTTEGCRKIQIISILDYAERTDGWEKLAIKVPLFELFPTESIASLITF